MILLEIFQKRQHKINDLRSDEINDLKKADLMLADYFDELKDELTDLEADVNKKVSLKINFLVFFTNSIFSIEFIKQLNTRSYKVSHQKYLQDT